MGSPQRIWEIKENSVPVVGARPGSTSHSVVYDCLRLGHKAIQVGLVLEALRVDLVDVLGARRPGREPAAAGHDFQAPDWGVVPGGTRQFGRDRLAGQRRR